MTGTPATGSTSPSGSPAASESQPGGVTAVSLEPFASGLSAPVALTHAGDGSGQLYAVEQRGYIRVIEPDGAVSETPFLEIPDGVIAGGERGLLGLAFHPEYPDDPRIFVMYTAAPDGANTISEFTVASGTADPASERILLAIPDFAGNHNGGNVVFGPDGYLYAGTGDGGGGGDPQENGQNPNALLGKILRIDVDSSDPYGIPEDNPFADGTGGAPEVWAIGMRNPWRFSFDRDTGDLWIADVGQSAWEEIDAEPPGEGGRNYGWNTMEGPECYGAAECDQTGLTLPVAAYTHDEGCTVIGGFVYRGSDWPALTGTYLYGDYCSGRLWGLNAEAAMGAQATDPVPLLDAGVFLSAFGEDEAGELYAVDLGGGAILRVVPDGGN